MSSIAVQPRLLPSLRQGAREDEAQAAERDVLSRLRIVSRRAHKVMSPHSRQYAEQQLAGDRGLRLSDLAYALSALDQVDRAYVLAPVVEGRESGCKPPLVEMAEATEAVGVALGTAQRVLASQGATPRDLLAVEAHVQAAVRELSDVPRAMRGGKR
ncbi:MAG: hypothetical protein HY825_13425 [Acidobacteria bacterium]|nr:hypothetical protein [Acidobacteriota bacterium]